MGRKKLAKSDVPESTLPENPDPNFPSDAEWAALKRIQRLEEKKRVVINVKPELAVLITEVAELNSMPIWKLLEELPLRKWLLQRKRDALREKAAQMEAVEEELAQLEAFEKIGDLSARHPK